MSSSLYKSLPFLWCLFFLFSFSLGYHTINPVISEHIPKSADAYIYKNMVENGLSGVGSDHRSSRVVIPLIAHEMLNFLPAKLGAWNVPVFSLLMVNAFFCASTALLIFCISLILALKPQVGFIASLLFFLNFTVSNNYLAGLVDVGECFCVTLTVLLLLVNKWHYLPIIGLLGVGIKETFFPVATMFILTWLLLEYKEGKPGIKLKLLYFFICTFLGFATLILLKSFSYKSLTFPWQYAKHLQSTQSISSVSITLDGLRRFLYVFIWLIPLGLIKIKELPSKWVLSSAVSMLVMVLMGIWVGTSGAGMSRYLFNVFGPLLCISASIFIAEQLKSYELKSRSLLKGI